MALSFIFRYLSIIRLSHEKDDINEFFFERDDPSMDIRGGNPIRGDRSYSHPSPSMDQTDYVSILFISIII